VSADDKTG